MAFISLCSAVLVMFTSLPTGQCQTGTIFDMLMGGGGGSFLPQAARSRPFGIGPVPRRSRLGPLGPATVDPLVAYERQQAQLWNTEEHLAETLTESGATSPERKRVDAMLLANGGRLTGDAAPLNYLVQEYYATTPGPTPPPNPVPAPQKTARNQKRGRPGQAQTGSQIAAQSGQTRLKSGKPRRNRGRSQGMAQGRAGNGLGGAGGGHGAVGDFGASGGHRLPGGHRSAGLRGAGDRGARSHGLVGQEAGGHGAPANGGMRRGGAGTTPPSTHQGDIGWQVHGQGFAEPSHVRLQHQAAGHDTVTLPKTQPPRFDRQGALSKLQQLREQLYGLAKKFNVPPLPTRAPKRKPPPQPPSTANIAPNRMDVIQNQIGSLAKPKSSLNIPQVNQKIKNPRVQGIEDQINALVKLREKLLKEDKHQPVGTKPPGLKAAPTKLPVNTRRTRPTRRPNHAAGPSRMKARPNQSPGPSRQKANRKAQGSFHPNVMTRPPKPPPAKPRRRMGRFGVGTLPNHGSAQQPMVQTAPPKPKPTPKPPKLGDVRYMHGDKYVYTDADGFDTFQWIKVPPAPPASGKTQGNGQSHA